MVLSYHHGVQWFKQAIGRWCKFLIKTRHVAATRSQTAINLPSHGQRFTIMNHNHKPKHNYTFSTQPPPNAQYTYTQRHRYTWVSVCAGADIPHWKLIKLQTFRPSVESVVASTAHQPGGTGLCAVSYGLPHGLFGECVCVCVWHDWGTRDVGQDEEMGVLPLSTIATRELQTDIIYYVNTRRVCHPYIQSYVYTITQTLTRVCAFMCGCVRVFYAKFAPHGRSPINSVGSNGWHWNGDALEWRGFPTQHKCYGTHLCLSIY